jgi:hypothetical protein
MHILRAIAFVFPEIGYCQGMNYIAATLMAYLKDTELTFELFVAIIVHKRLTGLFRNQVPEFHLRHFMLQHLIKQHLPQLHAHFKKVGLDLSALTGHWLMTLFNGYLSYRVQLAVMDNFLTDGWTSVFRVAIAIL